MHDIPEAALRARQLYLDGRKNADIRNATGYSLHKLYMWLAGGPERDGVRPLPPIPLRRAPPSGIRGEAARAALVARMMNVAERQVQEIEAKLIVPDAELEGRERNARVLAVLVKTLSELAAADTRAPRARKPKAEDDDAIPRHLDDLRRELSQRLDSMAAGTAAGISLESGVEGH